MDKWAKQYDYLKNVMDLIETTSILLGYDTNSSESHLNFWKTPYQTTIILDKHEAGFPVMKFIFGKSSASLVEIRNHKEQERALKNILRNL